MASDDVPTIRDLADRQRLVVKSLQIVEPRSTGEMQMLAIAVDKLATLEHLA